MSTYLNLVYDSSSIRTNNNVEGLHSSLKMVIGKAHPHVFEIFESFEKQQDSTKVSLVQLANSATPP